MPTVNFTVLSNGGIMGTPDLRVLEGYPEFDENERGDFSQRFPGYQQRPWGLNGCRACDASGMRNLTLYATQHTVVQMNVLKAPSGKLVKVPWWLTVIDTTHELRLVRDTVRLEAIAWIEGVLGVKIDRLVQNLTKAGGLTIDHPHEHAVTSELLDDGSWFNGIGLPTILLGLGAQWAAAA